MTQPPKILILQDLEVVPRQEPRQYEAPRQEPRRNDWEEVLILVRFPDQEVDLVQVAEAQVLEEVSDQEVLDKK